MIIWVDAQLSPALARWIRETFQLEAYAVREVGLRDAKDSVIFNAARDAEVVIMSKDEDFRLLVERLGATTNLMVDVWEYFERKIARNSDKKSTSGDSTVAARRAAGRDQQCPCLIRKKETFNSAVLQTAST